MKQVQLNGKAALVTGANSGIGAVTARELALRGYHVFLACRSEEKTRPVLERIAQESGGSARAEFLSLDLADLDSVRACAAQFLARGLPLPLLVCNAGIAGKRGLTKQGFELTFGVCHLGHFLLTQLLLDRIRQSAPSRIVVVASTAHYQNKTGIDFEALRRRTPSTTGLPEYSVAKLSNVLFASELARRLKGTGVTAYSLHPGVVATDIWRHVPRVLQPLIKLFMISEEKGAATTLHCALSDEAGRESGLYYDNCKTKTPSKIAQDPSLAKRLWEESERWLASPA